MHTHIHRHKYHHHPHYKQNLWNCKEYQRLNMEDLSDKEKGEKFIVKKKG